MVEHDRRGGLRPLAITVGLLMVLAVGSGACGSATSPERLSTAPSVPSQPPPVPPGPPTDGAATTDGSSSWTPPSLEIQAAFDALAASESTMTVFGPTELPADAALLTKSAAGSLPGPYSLGRVAMQNGSSRLLVMEGMHGDVGDLPGEECGLVAGHPARAYRVLGGELVQWSDGEAWYGVYGLAMARDDVVRVARGMVPLGRTGG